MVKTSKKSIKTSKTTLKKELKVGRLEENKIGRKRDPLLDVAILKAALEVLAESGYDGMTMDGVAECAKVGKAALYRRWPSKESLVLDAVTHMKQAQVDLHHLPDTGTLRGDLLALVKPQSNGEGDFKLKVISGLSAIMNQHQRLAAAGAAAIVDPWSNVYRKLINRSVERGESIVSAEIETITQIVPSMMAFRSMVLRKPFDKNYLISIVDGVVLPALGITNKKQKNN